MSERIEWLDIAKGIGISLVVFAHSISPGIMYNWISMFHMPLFFCISGMCYNENKYGKFSLLVKSRSRQLLNPLFWFTAIVFFCCYLLRLNLCDFKKGVPAGLWFVEILFIVELLYWIIARAHKYIRIIAVASLLPCAFFLCKDEISAFYSLKTIPAALFFYGLGHLSRQHVIKLSLPKLNSGVSATVFLGCPLCFVLYTHETIRMISNHIPSPFILAIVASILGIAGIFLLSMTLTKWFLHNFFVFLGRNTLIILGVHMTILEFAATYIKPYFANPIMYLTSKIAFVVFSIWVCIIVINRYFKLILGK